MDLTTALTKLPSSPTALEPFYWDDPDPSKGSRRPHAGSRGSSRASLAISAGNRFRMMHVESGLEYKWAVVFDGLLKPSFFLEQPAPISYIDSEGKKRSKRFDFFLVTSDRRIFVEIKPAYKVKKYGLEAIYQHISSQISAEIADEVLLLTDEDLHPDAVANAQLLRSSRRYPPWDLEDVLLRAAHGADEDVSISGLIRAAGTEVASGFVAALRLIDHGRLVVRDEGRISHRSRVHLVSRCAYRERPTDGRSEPALRDYPATE
jgi:hypothetical protein